MSPRAYYATCCYREVQALNWRWLPRASEGKITGLCIASHFSPTYLCVSHLDSLFALTTLSLRFIWPLTVKKNGV